ncbi:MAG TPA: DapH/DapD/GlmU-related protein, partial [Candidatus Binatia bacterium]
EGIDIGEDVWIGAGCKVLDGVRIGKGAVIGAGSVVTKNIGSYAVAVGVPATVVRSRRSPAQS